LKSYPYKESTIDYLNKTSLFLIDHFHQIYQNMGKSRKIKKNEYHLATLNENVKLQCIPAGYHSPKPPSNNNSCDYCNQRFKINDEYEGIMLICGHAYHYKCFGEKTTDVIIVWNFIKKVSSQM
jgi:hypothetical protein